MPQVLHKEAKFSPFEETHALLVMQQQVESVCEVCDKQFNLTKNLNRHGKVHEVQRCKDCGIYFNAKKDLRNHKLQVHARRKSKEDDPFAAIEDAEFVLA